MDKDRIGGGAVNFGGTVADAAGRPADDGESAPKDATATVKEQLDRILPQGRG